MMVSKKEAFKAAAISAVVVGVIHYIAHTFIAPMFPKVSAVMLVGIIVVLSVFGVAYWGMNPK
jgi:hypothetical protein